MKPLKCCKTCNNYKGGQFRNKLKCMFCEAYGKELILKLYNEQKVDKGCSTCKYCEHIRDYPAYVTGEECECTAGLKCDTVLFAVKNCSKWAGKYESEEGRQPWEEQNCDLSMKFDDNYVGGKHK